MNAYIIYKLSSKSKKQATSPGRHDMKFKIEVSKTIDTLAHGLVSWFGTLHPPYFTDIQMAMHSPALPFPNSIYVPL